MASFQSYALSKKMVAALASQGYTSPTPIQDAVIPKVLRGESLIARSETGSGKTHAFLIPIIERLDLSAKEIQAVVVAPTRELAKQTYDFAKKFVIFYPGLRVQLLSSGEEKSRSLEKLVNLPHLIIATPGRLHDFAVQEKAANFLTCKTVVLDEADMLMEMGFFNDFNIIISNLVKPQILVFSATIPEKLASSLEHYVEPKHIIELQKENLTASQVKHYLIDTRHQNLKECLKTFIELKHPYLLLVFASRKETVMEMYSYLRELKYPVGVIHGDLEIRERKAMMRRIRNNEFSIVVASDIASRGLDVLNVSDVLNIDFPKDLEFYFHRAGRTGRNGKEGNCFSFYDNDHTAAAQKLTDLGVKFEYLVMKDGAITGGKPLETKPTFRRKKTGELEKEIRKAVSQASSKTVKPRYKEKVRKAVEKVKSHHRRLIIKSDIRKRQVERYKGEGRGE